jgi:phosphatidylinositol alpha-1,6-mannosyltransferase
MSGPSIPGATPAEDARRGPEAPRRAVVVRPERGGVAYVAAGVAGELRRRGTDVVEVVAADDGPRAPARAALRSVWDARRALRRADVVHVEVGRTAVGALWVAVWAAVLRDDVVFVTHDGPELVNAPGSGLIRTAPGRRDAFAHRVLAPLTDGVVRAWLKRRVGHWVTVSDEAAGRAKAAGLGPVSTVGLPAGSGPGAGPVVAAPPSASATVLFAGHLAPTKGLEVLADAWAEAGAGRDATLVVVGGHSRQHDRYVAGVRDAYGRLPARTRWVGWVDDATFAAELAGAAVVVLPYLASNPASGVLVRALASGRPVVATRVEAVESLPAAMRDALLVVEPGDRTGLAAAIARLLDDPAGRDRLGARAARAAATRPLAAQVDELVGLYPVRAPAGPAAGPEGAGRRARRALLVSPVFPPALGGIEALAGGIAEGLDRRVTVVTLREPGWRHWDTGAPFRIVRAGNTPRGGRRSIIRLSVRAVLCGLATRPDVVVVMHVRGAYAATILRRLTRTRWVQLYHAKEIVEFPRAAALAARRADAHVVPSRYTRDLVARIGVPPGRTRLVPLAPAPARRATSGTGSPPRQGVNGPGVDGPTPAARRRPGSLVTVSRLADAYKGHDVMIDALVLVAAVHADVRWSVVGDGPLRPSLEDRARRAGLEDRISWLGAVDDDGRDALLESSDVFVMPSRVVGDGLGGEGFGLVFLEAAGHGLPVVAGDAGGGVDAVVDGVTGVLVDATSPRAVADAVIGLLADRDRLERMRGEGRRWAATFSWSRFLSDIESVIDDVVGPPAP